MAGLAGLRRVRGGFGRVIFFKKIYGTSSGSSLFHENFSCAEIRQLPKGSAGTHTGKLPVFLISNRALLPDIAHCLDLPVGKSYPMFQLSEPRSSWVRLLLPLLPFSYS